MTIATPELNVTGALDQEDRKMMETRIDAYNLANGTSLGYADAAERKTSYETVVRPFVTAFWAAEIDAFRQTNIDKPKARDIITLLRDNDYSTAELNAILAAFP